MNDTDDVLAASWVPSRSTDPDGDDEVVLTDEHFDRAEFTDTDRAASAADLSTMRQIEATYFERLGELRRALGATQTQVADHMGTSQPAVAAIEARSDVRLSTLYRYLDAIGGTAKLLVSFDGTTQVLIPLEQLLAPAKTSV